MSGQQASGDRSGSKRTGGVQGDRLAFFSSVVALHAEFDKKVFE
jgi:hypothetical protein